MLYACLDLETRVNVALARGVLHLPSNLTDVEARSRLLERTRERRGGRDFPALTYHVPIAAAVLLAERGPAEDAPILPTAWRCWHTGELDLGAMVERFYADVRGRVCVGFNSESFDVPLLGLWASRFGVVAPELVQADLQKLIAGRGAGGLDELARFHGLPGKPPGVAGPDVEDVAAQGRLGEIAAYNVTDVVQTWLLFLHAEIRTGRLSRKAAGVSARAAIELARAEVAPLLPAGSPSRELLETCLTGCAAAPISSW